MLPVLVGLAPAGFAVGAAWSGSGLPIVPGIVASATVYGASAQLLVADLSTRGAGVVLLALATAIVSLRLTLLGIGLGRRLRGASTPVRWVAALVLVDPAYVVAEGEMASRPGANATAGPYRVYLGAALTLWTGWQVAHLAGALMGPVVPPDLALDFTLPLCLLGLIAPRLADRAVRSGVLAAAGVAVAVQAAPFGCGVILAVAAGLWAAARAEGQR